MTSVVMATVHAVHKVVLSIECYKLLQVSVILVFVSTHRLGWLGGTMVLGKLPVPGRPSNLADCRARA